VRERVVVAEEGEEEERRESGQEHREKQQHEGPRTARGGSSTRVHPSRPARPSVRLGSGRGFSFCLVGSGVVGVLGEGEGGNCCQHRDRPPPQVTITIAPVSLLDPSQAGQQSRAQHRAAPAQHSIAPAQHSIPHPHPASTRAAAAVL
jgi:hypothetical protein